VDRPAYKGAPEDYYPVEMSFPLPGQGARRQGLLEGIDYTVNPGMQIPCAWTRGPAALDGARGGVSMLRDLLVAFLLVPVVLACVAAGLAAAAGDALVEARRSAPGDGGGRGPFRVGAAQPVGACALQRARQPGIHRAPADARGQGAAGRRFG